ncbi:MAG TPA: endolytic transglycosylase MltG [Rectinemataceae bacterium]|nr:endolytic transglycosylase MltG [Rectinemataceae bacterium]
MVAGFLVAAALAFELRPADGIPAGGKLFSVERGDESHSLGKKLEDEGLIRSELLFRVLAKLRGPEASFKIGTYRIMPKMATAAIMDLLLSGRQALVRITVPEGFTISQTAALLDRNGIATAADFEKACHDPALLGQLGLPFPSAEGYLFPDTYFFPASYGGAAALREMVSTFRERLSSIPEAAGLSARELNDRVILASIVEREYKQPDEAPIIASVFENRLRIHMALQSCATVVYVLTEREGKPHPEIIYDRDLVIRDPYNTYIHPGLPPGPICSPGMTSLQAVFHPAKTHYLYFRLVDPVEGRHHFSTNLAEHIDARELFIKKVGG